MKTSTEGESALNSIEPQEATRRPLFGYEFFSETAALMETRVLSRLYFGLAAIVLMAALTTPSAHGALVTYFNFNDLNETSDAPGLQVSSITQTRLTPSFVAGTTLNQAPGDLTGAGSALRLTAGANGAKTLQFTVSTIGFTDLSLSFAAKGSGFTSGTLSLTVNGVTTTNGSFSVTQTGTFQTVNLDLSSYNQIENKTSVTFQIALSPINPTGSGPFFVDFDNIQLNSQVPEPGTVAAGILAVFGMAWHQRRRLPNAGRFLRFERK